MERDSEVIGVEVPGGRLAVELTGSPPAYPAAAVQAFRDALEVLVTVQPLAGADHAATIMTPAGARASAGLIAEARS